VTLDTKTAHPALVVSEDLRSVRREREEQDMTDTPERFTVHCCVLGREGFREGRHCWEVEVEAGSWSRWAFGVARESVERKRYVDLSPGEGIWAVENWYQQFRSLTSPPTVLSLSSLPRRIWVCLDCTRGLVTFINADNGLHIFTFPPAAFNGETLCPWFCVGTEKTHLHL
ncbi:Butyrophilin subfamily 2 member A2, partial [Charadrius vociferus]